MHSDMCSSAHCILCHMQCDAAYDNNADSTIKEYGKLKGCNLYIMPILNIFGRLALLPVAGGPVTFATYLLSPDSFKTHLSSSRFI